MDRRVMRRLGERFALTRRAIWIGLGMVAFVAALTPYNDYVVQNTSFIGNHFPIGIISLMVILILVVNPAIMLFTRRPLSTGELVVIMTMMMVGAAAPSSGLMRYLEPMLVSPFWLVKDFPWLEPIAKLMPGWLVPTKDLSSPIVTNYWLGIDPVQGSHVPIVAFLLPSLLWGVLIASILGTAMFVAAIFRKQWVHHERLTFPLATIPLELMATPERGRWLNRLWRNPVLWAGAGIPLVVYLLAGLHQRYSAVPFVDLRFDIHSAFTDRPWDALPPYLSAARIYLSVIGICFFVPSEIAFSLWLFIVLNGLVRVICSQTSFDPAQNEQARGMGIYLGYFAGLLWLARGHLRMVLNAAWRGEPRDEAEPLTYRAMVVGLAVCGVVSFGWLVTVGMNPLLAILLLGVGTVLMTLMARIVAETGLFFVGPTWWPGNLIGSLLGPKLVNALNYYWSQVISRIFYADLRENLMPFAVNALRMGQEIDSRRRPQWFRWLFVALFVSVLVSGFSHHFISYAYGRNSLDGYASNQMPFDAMQETYTFTNTAPQTTVSGSWLSFGFGAVMVGLLMVGRVMWVSWPFHPIGLLLMNSGPLQAFWFSIFLGWGIKKLLLRYGGAGGFRRARPFFIGLIVGEMLAAGGWLIAGLATHGALRYVVFPP
ncbi:MAG TPA: DUF6785 family protein [Phycisphaerae bacterium]|nr:DUF6785 family protein [Phycisphaerae bacterium]